MDSLVLGLAASGAALTVGGIVGGTRDVARRLSSYRQAERDAAAARAGRDLGPILNPLRDKQAFLVAQEVEHVKAALAETEARLAAFSGATEKLRSLLISGAVTLAGVLLGSTADIIAAARTR